MQCCSLVIETINSQSEIFAYVEPLCNSLLWSSHYILNCLKYSVVGGVSCSAWKNDTSGSQNRHLLFLLWTVVGEALVFARFFIFFTNFSHCMKGVDWSTASGRYRVIYFMQISAVVGIAPPCACEQKKKVSPYITLPLKRRPLLVCLALSLANSWQATTNIAPVC